MSLVSRSRSRSSIKTKSLALFAGYVLALGAVYFAFSYYLLEHARTAMRDRLQQTAAMVTAEMDTYIQGGRQRLLTVARLPGLVYGLGALSATDAEGPIAPWTSLHYLFFKSAVFTGGVFLVDDKGVVLWTEPPGLPWLRQPVGEMPTVASVLRQRGGISGALPPDALIDRPHALLSAGIDTPSGQRAGALIGIIDLTAPEFTAPLKGVSIEDGQFAALVDQHGKVLAGTGGVQILASLPSEEEETPLASAPLVNAPWRTMAGQPQDTALAPIRNLQRLLLSVGALLSLAVLAVGIPFVTRFLRSVEALTSAAEVMASGDLSQPVDVGPRRDELATLARTFERMRVEIERSRDRLEQRLEERDQLIRLKEEFLANISHELRTPLNVIIGYTDMLLDLHGGEQGADLLRNIRSQSQHLFHLLRDLMTLSDLNRNRVEIEVAPVEARQVLAALAPLTDELARGREVEATWDCPDDLPLIHTDVQRLEQILASLIENAFKFTPHGRIAVRVRREGAALAFEVEDTGVGIPAEELADIFDEFRQVDGSMSRSHGGIGVGLALVHKLTGLLRGHISVSSEVGRGSTFRLVLPLDPGPAPSGESAAAAA